MCDEARRSEKACESLVSQGGRSIGVRGSTASNDRRVR
jgi:hypothetical protein